MKVRSVDAVECITVSNHYVLMFYICPSVSDVVCGHLVVDH
jgi:hypothetical protein